jgi:hypothetical protein
VSDDDVPYKTVAVAEHRTTRRRLQLDVVV